MAMLVFPPSAEACRKRHPRTRPAAGTAATGRARRWRGARIDAAPGRDKARLRRRLGALLAVGAVATLFHPPALAAEGCRREHFHLVIDVGHHPAAPGAISARGVPELAFNQALATTTLTALAASGFHRAQLLDAEGSLPALPQRVARLRQLAPALLISLHHDSVQPHYLETWTWRGEPRRFSDRFRGFSLFVSRRNGDVARSLEAARAIGEALRAAGFVPSLHHAEDIAGERRPLLDAELGLYAGDRFAILAHDGAPAVLIEAGIIVNREEETMLASDAFRRRFAAALVAAVDRYCAQLAAGGTQR